MTEKIRPYDLLLFAIILMSCRSSLAGDKRIDYCGDIASKVLRKPDLIETNVLPITQDPSCFFQANSRSITPLRTSLWDAVESLSPAQQQGSSLSSSGSTNAVSKPSGPTALTEEFGGADVTRGTSSTTVQWAPGKMLANLALTGTDPLCLNDHVPTGCISARLITDLTPLTFKITANTSSGTASVAGTPANPTSSAPAQQVNVTSQGSSGPNFSGFTVQYSLINSRGKASVKCLTTPVATPNDKNQGGKDASVSTEGCGKRGSTKSGKGGRDAAATPEKGEKKASTDDPYETELDEMHGALVALPQCDAYTKGWGPQAEEELREVIATDKDDRTKTDDARREDLRKEIENQYTKLFAMMQASNSCNEAVKHLRSFYATILEAKTYDDFGAQSASAKPLLALEYDLNTPQNRPSYSSAKATLNWQFGKATPTSQSGSTKANSDPKRQTEAQARKQAVHNYAISQIKAVTSAGAGGSADRTKQTAAQSKSLAQDTAQPFSLTITGTADIYNAEPASSIPSASHLRDIQAGGELAYVFSPFGKTSFLGKSLGALTLAGAYSYEDQTSPAILTGPALTDFTGLPSSTTAAYAKRGVIHLGQVRLGFGTGKNLTYPLAFTYSNRTELITHPTWGLQFGITYNLTSLFNSSGTGKSPASH
jgi:hypothetical protein